MSKRPWRVVVTGVGRCGTGYMAEVLGRCGLKVGHEVCFTPWGYHRDSGRRYEGDSSWLAAPYLGEDFLEDAVLVQVVRDPVLVLRSHVGIGMWADEPDAGHVPYVRYAERHAGPFVGTPGERAAEFMYRWDGLIRVRGGRRVVRVKVEDPGTWGVLAERFPGVMAVPRDVNTRGLRGQVAGELELVADLRREWGYGG